MKTNKYQGQYFELDPYKVVVEAESPAYYKLLKAGWFTWETNDDGERIMTCIEGALDLEDVLK